MDRQLLTAHSVQALTRVQLHLPRYPVPVEVRVPPAAGPVTRGAGPHEGQPEEPLVGGDHGLARRGGRGGGGGAGGLLGDGGGGAQPFVEGGVLPLVPRLPRVVHLQPAVELLSTRL